MPNTPRKEKKETSYVLREIFDVLSDGKVHKLYEISEVGKNAHLTVNYNACVRAGRKDKNGRKLTIVEAANQGGEKLIRETIESAVSQGILTKTATGYKMLRKKDPRWGRRPDASHQTDPFFEGSTYSPQQWGEVAEYGGMTEWEGWSYAPLETRDLVHVRLVHPIPLDTLLEMFPVWDVTESPEGSVVVAGKPGDPVKGAVMEWLLKNNIPYESVREAKNVKRRDLRKLPSSFLQDLMNRSIPLAYSTVAKKHRASMEVLTGSLEDTKAWVSLWVVEFATMFDAEKGRPFAAWAQIQIKHKVQDLNRSINGRTASDLEIKWARAQELLEARYGRQPTVEEISKELNISLGDGQMKRSIIGQMKAIRSAAPLDTGPDTADLPLIDHLADPEEETLRRETKQRVTMAILSAAGVLDEETNQRELELPLGFIATYLMEWDDWVKSDLIALSGCASSKITKELVLLRSSLKNQLEDLYSSF